MRRFVPTAAVLTAMLTVPSAAGASLVISEHRLRGPNGANDEFIEVHNRSDVAFVVTPGDGSSGFSLVASDGVSRATIPAGTIIPARGHWLAVNSVAHSLSAYPAGNGTTATGDATYTTNIPDNAGVALFDTADPASFDAASRLDAVGSTSEPDPLYREGAGYPALTPFSTDYSFIRNEFGGTSADTDDNAADLIFVDTQGISAGAGQRLGAPGPENLSSPITGGPDLEVELADPGEAPGAPPNTVRDLTSDPANNSAFGTIDLRRKVTNTGSAEISRLRFRIVDVSTFPAPTGRADLRPRSSADITDTIDGTTTTVRGTVLEQPPSQTAGGGLNSSLSVQSVTLATPLAPGDSVFVRFVFGVQKNGAYEFCALGETLPGSASRFGQAGSTAGGSAFAECGAPPVAPACDETLAARGCWSFGEPAGTTALDSSSQGNDGTYVNGPTLGVPGIAAGDTAVAMDGANDHVVVPDSPSLDVGDSFTLEGWIKRDEDGRTHQLFNKGGRGFHLLVMDRFNGNQVWLRKAGASTIVRSTGGSGVPADGQFHHVVATKDGPNSARIYIDGIEQPLQQVSPGQVIQDTAFGLFFSATPSGNPVDGVLDEFAVYDAVLSPADVWARFSTGSGTSSMSSTMAASSETTARSGGGTSTGDGRCADIGRQDSGATEVRVAGLSCERGAELIRGGPKHLDAAGLHCTITREDFSGPIVRITRECRGSDGRFLKYTTLS